MSKFEYIHYIFFALWMIVQLTVKAHECSYDEECREIADCDEVKYLMKREYAKMPSVCGTKINTRKHCCKIRFPEQVTGRPQVQPKLINAPRCGTYRIPPKLIGGSVARVEEFPWMALLQYKSTVGDNELKFLCGGSLISAKYILTAAHCVKVRGYKLVSVRLGEHTISKDIDCDDYEDEDTCSEDPVQDIPIEETVLHPNYKINEKSNDIALVRLSHDAIMSDNVGTICLPVEEGHSVIENLEDIEISNMTITGWGRTESGKRSDVLLFALVRYLKPDECNARMEYTSSLFRSFKVTVSESHLCAGGDGNVDACAGDSGSPIIYPAKIFNKHRMLQYGVVAAGSKNCSSLLPIPGIYTRVTSYMEWIIDNLRE